MYEKLLKTITNLDSPRVLVVGDFMLDVYIYGDALRISPEAPVPVLKVTKTDYSCGGAGSVAADLTALGAKALCLGVYGKDQNGDRLKGMLAERGVDTAGLIAIDKRPTISKQRLIGLAQHRHQQQLIRFDQESVEQLSDEQNTQVLKLYKEKLKDVDIVCLQDHNKGLLIPLLCKEMIQSAKQANKKVIIDPSLTSDYLKYAGATLITPNRNEASRAVKDEIKSIDDAQKAAEKLIDDLKLQAVIITLDKEGAYLKTKQQGKLIPTRVRNVYDVTGAGDMVLATLAIALAADCDYEIAVQLCNITGGLEVERFGNQTVSREDVINELIAQNRGKSGKIRSLQSLVEELNCFRNKEKIVFTNGCFDVIHRGHIEFLKFCKEQGTILVLGLNSDNSVKTIKGPKRPINNQDDRASVLEALEPVDYITIFDEPEPLNLIEEVKPDILIKGEDWAKKGVVGRELVESYGGKVILAPLVKGKSSTSVIEKIKTVWKKIDERKD